MELSYILGILCKTNEDYDISKSEKCDYSVEVFEYNFDLVKFRYFV